jgi:hypothetical protein
MTAALTLAKKRLRFAINLPNPCAKAGTMRMSVLPHRSDKTEPQASAAPSQQRAKVIAASTLRIAERIAKLADDTAKETKNVTANAVAAGKVGLARAVEIGRGNVLPEIERASAKIKQHARRDKLERDYRTYLLKLHERVLDPAIEQLFFKPTKDHVPLSGLTIRGNNRAYGHDYRPSPCRLVEWLISAIDYDLSRLTFVDHGAGKGRVLLLASQYPFQAIGGVEFAEELHDDATMNIAQFPRSRMKCRNVECVLDDAAALGPPDGESVHYFLNPFSRELFAEVLDNIVVSYRNRPRRLYLILVDPIGTDLIDQSGVFQRHALPQIERLKVKAFSPYEVAVYRTLA